MSSDALLVALAAVFMVLVALGVTGVLVLELRRGQEALASEFRSQIKAYFGVHQPMGSPPGQIQPSQIPAEMRAVNELTQETLDQIEESLINEYGYSPEDARREISNVKAQLEGGAIIP